MRDRGILVVDFDSTLVRTACRIIVHKATGARVTYTTDGFTQYRREEGDRLDFSDYEVVRRPQLLEANVRLVRTLLRRGWDGYVCTARENRRPIDRFLRIHSLDLGVIPACNRPDLKRSVVEQVLREGLPTVFMDDWAANVQAVQSLTAQYPNLRTIQV